MAPARHLRLQRRARRGVGLPDLGLVGPRIAELAGSNGAPAQLKDNPFTWLAFTDLVMIDPVGTGWSRPAKPDGGKSFYGVNGDAQALAKAIALYTAKNGRGNSPKYILGESYGGFRAAKVPRCSSANRAFRCPASSCSRRLSRAA